MTAPLTQDALAGIAERFRALGDPSRLAILQALRDGERPVTELAAATGQSHANVSRHLGVLLHANLVTRRREGPWAWYRAEPEVWALCDLVCGRLERDAARPLRLAAS